MKKKYQKQTENVTSSSRATRKRHHSGDDGSLSDKEETSPEQINTATSPDHAQDTTTAFPQHELEVTADDKVPEKAVLKIEPKACIASPSSNKNNMAVVGWEADASTVTVDETGNDVQERAGAIQSPAHQHDLNNNSLGEAGADKQVTESEYKVMIVEAEEESSSMSCQNIPETDEEASMECADTRDIIVRTGLYGTDVDPSYQDGLPANSATPTNPPPDHVEDGARGLQRDMPPPRPSHFIQQEDASHPSQYLTPQGLVQSYPDQQYRVPAQFDSRDSMSVSNQANTTSGETGHFKEGERLTSFRGIFKQTTADHAHSSSTERDLMRQQYSDQACGQFGHLAVHEPSGQQGYLASSVYAAANSGHTAPGAIDDCHIAAEQLASELVKNYGGQNSHMITDILKREGDQQFVCDGFERPSQELGQYADSSQSELQDVDLLNTPQQLPVEDVVYHQQARGYGQTGPPVTRSAVPFGSPQACSTPDCFQKNLHSLHTPQNLRGHLTYNDVQPHGSKWSAGKEGGRIGQLGFERSENPCPETCLPARHQQQVYPNMGQYPGAQSPDIGTLVTNAFGNFSASKAFMRSPPRISNYNANHHQSHFESAFSPKSKSMSCYSQGNVGLFSGVKSPSVLQDGEDYQRQTAAAGITKMTFTPRDMMETHLSQTYNFQKQHANANARQPMSEMAYSSIYPRRDFIERAPGGELSSSKPGSQKPGSYDHNPPPKKRHRMSKISSPEMPSSQDPPSMPIIDDMIAKYPPGMQRDPDASRHKYFVVNPSDATSMTPRTLLCKYIDFLVLENEQITEISKSLSPPVDIYVTEDMYFMDSLKYRMPFPSKKFTEWVSSFYPKLNFWDMKFKGSTPKEPTENMLKMVDGRQTQQILEDTFYFFQREVMSTEAPI